MIYLRFLSLFMVFAAIYKNIMYVTEVKHQFERAKAPAVVLEQLAHICHRTLQI